MAAWRFWELMRPAFSRQAWERYRKCKKALKEIRAMQKRDVRILVAKIKERGIFYE